MAFTNQSGVYIYKGLLTFQQMDAIAENDIYFKSGNAVPTGAWTFAPGSAIVPITIDQNEDEKGLLIDSESTSEVGLAVYGKYGIYSESDLGGGRGLFVKRDQNEAGSEPLVTFLEDNVASTQNVLGITNNGTGYGIEIIQNGASFAGMFIDSRTGGTAASYFAANKATGYCSYFLNDGNNVNRWGVGIQCGQDAGAGDNYMITFLDGDGTVHGYITLDDGTIEIEQASDRKKEHVKNTKSVLDKINQLRVVDYNFKKIKDKTHTGFMDKEVREVFPNIGKYNKKRDLYTITPLKLIPLLVKAVQELDAKVKALEG